MTPALFAGCSQEFIDLVSCYDDYTHYGIATVCDGDNLTADEIDESECPHTPQDEIFVCDKCGTDSGGSGFIGTDDCTAEELCALMCDPPAWAKDLPPAAEGGIMNRYRK